MNKHLPPDFTRNLFQRLVGDTQAIRRAENLLKADADLRIAAALERIADALEGKTNERD